MKRKRVQEQSGRELTLVLLPGPIGVHPLYFFDVAAKSCWTELLAKRRDTYVTHSLSSLGHPTCRAVLVSPRVRSAAVVLEDTKLTLVFPQQRRALFFPSLCPARAPFSRRPFFLSRRSSLPPRLRGQILSPPPSPPPPLGAIVSSITPQMRPHTRIKLAPPVVITCPSEAATYPPQLCTGPTPLAPPASDRKQE